MKLTFALERAKPAQKLGIFIALMVLAPVGKRGHAVGDAVLTGGSVACHASSACTRSNQARTAR